MWYVSDFLSIWDGLPYFESQNVEEWSALRGNRVLSQSSRPGNMSRLTLHVWDVARPDNACFVTTHGDVWQTLTSDHLPAGARWGYADGNPSSEAPVFMLLQQQLSYLRAVAWLWGSRILDGWKSVIYFVAVYTLSTNQPTLVTGFLSGYLYTRKIIYRTPKFHFHFNTRCLVDVISTLMGSL